jgi:hypothetical protein
MRRHVPPQYHRAGGSDAALADDDEGGPESGIGVPFVACVIDHRSATPGGWKIARDRA